ncbi:hypothetical protein [Nonomuraea pusilla]|uniref:Uncharacterized protein n=1 Tax=Nonomuraea pusilla TaxID=46177 RepID=A0A1H8FZ09_9ACTN|nr:hypothetical protein [Nonomuraea pusilla]SEN36966.1 hypothetical protein SAMN05660976_07410 [Nonomuraea pusilla]
MPIRDVLILTMAGALSGAVMTALKLGSGAPWPDALSWGLGAAGATFATVWTMLNGRSGSNR